MMIDFSSISRLTIYYLNGIIASPFHVINSTNYVKVKWAVLKFGRNLGIGAESRGNRMGSGLGNQELENNDKMFLDIKLLRM